MGATIGGFQSLHPSFLLGGQVHDMHDICLDWKTSLMAVRAVLRPDNPHPLNPP
jgi:hypothetical protein